MSTDEEKGWSADRLATLPGDAAARRAAFERFEAEGVPGRALEEWKFTDLRRLLARTSYGPPPEGATPGAELQPALDRARSSGLAMVFVDGRFRPDLSRLEGLPAGARVESLADLLERGDPLLDSLGGLVGGAGNALTDLNAAWMEEGVALHLGRGVQLDRRLRLCFLSTGGATAYAMHPRLLAILEQGAAVTIMEEHATAPDARIFTNMVVEAVIGADARLRHYRRHDLSDTAIQVTTQRVDIERDGHYEGFTLAKGGRPSRVESHARLNGPGVEARFAGVMLGRERQHVDTTLAIEHRAPHCQSRQVYSTVLEGRARGVFQGKIAVAQEAQKTDGHQLNRALLLTDGAEMNAKPELEIFADDVKCSHGATAGRLDEEALFYLRARGIDEAEARRMLIEAFLAEAVDEITDLEAREEFQQAARAWLEAGAAT